MNGEYVASPPTLSPRSHNVAMLNADTDTDRYPVNPFALAELISGEAIDWSKESDQTKRLEQIFKVSSAKIFDPGGMLYNGAKDLLRAALAQFVVQPEAFAAAQRSNGYLRSLGVDCAGWRELSGPSRVARLRGAFKPLPPKPRTLGPPRGG
jgi:hypothetical protein